MSVARPDRGYCWVILFCCAYMHFALFGLFRSSGVMYFALLKEYNVTREEASWPFSLCPAVFQLFGPVVSLLSYYFSQRLIFVLGCSVATLGMVGCYFADSVLWITFFYGVIHGMGFGVLVTLIPVILNQYFLKHRATALGIAFSGGPLGSFVFPIALEWLLEHYNLRGTFLLVGGLMMNTLVTSALLRPAPWLKKPKKESKLFEDSEGKDSGVSTSGDILSEIKSPITPIGGVPFIPDDSDFYDSNPKNIEDVDSSELDTSSTVVRCDAPDHEKTPLSDKDILFGSSVGKVCMVTNSDSSYKNETKSAFEVQRESLLDGSSVSYVPVMTKNDDRKNSNKFRKAAHSILIILKNPVFHLIYFSMFIYFLALQCFFTVIVDYSIDKGLSEEDGAYVLSVFSIFDLAGRSGLGWVTDRNYLKGTHLLIFNFTFIGILLQLYPLINDLTGLFAVTAFHALITGNCISLFFVLLAEYLGLKRLTLVLGLSGFITGSLTLLRPTMIGLFRDTIGSYDWMFHSLGIASLAIAGIWIAMIWLEQNKKASVQDTTKKGFV